jgi:hypothetical protein
MSPKEGDIDEEETERQTEKREDPEEMEYKEEIDQVRISAEF